MTCSSIKSTLATPFITGEGGATFEQLVGTSYLVSILAADIPRGLDWGITKEVMLQHRWSGCLLDDIVVTSFDGNTTRKLALQVKHTLTFSNASSNTRFARVIKDCWDTFNGLLGWQFNQDADRVGIGLGVYPTNIDKHFRPLLELARTSKDAADFIEKVSLPTLFSMERQKYLQIIKGLLAKAKGCNVTDNELWRFLKCLVIIHFDFESAGSRDSIHCWNRLLDQLTSRDGGQAKLLFNNLTSIIAEYASSAGFIDRNVLKGKMPSSLSLKDEPNYATDLTNLRNFTDRFLESIHDTIGGKVRVPRLKLLDDVENMITDKEVVVIEGEPMVGKSVLLKLLANRLRAEGEIIAFSIDRLSGATIENFLHNINVYHDLKDILFAIGGAPLRCILIDGLERAARHEDKRRIINDIIIAIRNYNKSMAANGGLSDNYWKIIFTSRSLEAMNILQQLETQHNFIEKSIKLIEVESLSDEEVTGVVQQLPKLKALASQTHLREILSRPLVLDILTLPYVMFPSSSVPNLLTETWLLDWFWKMVVRCSNNLMQGMGYPDKREQLLLYLAEQSLGENKLIPITSTMDSEATSGLVSDGLLLREDGHLRFAHDVFEDWALAVLFDNHKNNIPEFLRKAGEPIGLARAFRLFASKYLEVKQSPLDWVSLLTTLESDDTLSPRWYQIVLTAPLFSPVTELIQQMQPYLFDKEGILLTKLLKALRISCVRPDPSAYLIFGDLPRIELEKYLAYMTIPIWPQWIPVIQIVLQNSDKLSDECILEFSYIAEKWMTTTNNNQPFRKEIVNFSLRVLNGGLLQSYKDEPKNQYVKSVLWAADCLPELVSEFVKKKTLRSRDEKNYGFEDLFLEAGWIPICKHLPKIAVNILQRILCRELKQDRFGGYLHLEMDYGITHTKWNPPTYLKGPFLGLLRLHSVEGLHLIKQVTNHATKCWRMIQELELQRKPVPQAVKLKASTLEIWGDEHVYTWHRYPTIAPDAVACALMALEYWMNERLKNGADPVWLFHKVLERTESAAVVGVCASVALANERICREAVIPILENPSFWYMDIFRLTQEMGAESSIKMFSTFFSLGHDRGDYNILLELAKQEHRKSDIRNFVLPILLSGSKESCEKLQNAMRDFPNNPPIGFEHERENAQLMNERAETCRIWAALAERQNYETFEVDDKRGIGIRFKLPSDLEKQQKEKTRLFEELNKLYSLQGWSMNFIDSGEIGVDFTIDSAMAYAKEIVNQDNPSYQPKNLHEDSELRANSIAAFAAALVIHQWNWLEKNNYVAWCRQQLLTAARRPEPHSKYDDEISRYPFGYRRSAARALPIFLGKYPKDKEIREVIFRISQHKNDEVRAYLYHAMKSLWTIDQETIWKCIHNTIKNSRKRIIYGTFRYLKQQASMDVKRWRYQNMLRLVTYLIKMPLFLISNNISQKPIGRYTHNDIYISYLESILYSIPIDSQIVSIPSSIKVIDLLSELIVFTVNTCVQFEKEDSHYNEWSGTSWNGVIFPIIANTLLALPVRPASTLLTPIISNWEKSPVIMEELLRNLSLVGTQTQYENRLVELWLYLGDYVLSSGQCKPLGYHLSSELKSILSLLIFADPVIKWKVQEWASLSKLTDFVGRWCTTVGYHPDCFPSLVRLLRTIGFSLIPEFGINWLHDCLVKIQNKKDFLKRSRATSQLGELLHDSWLKYEASIKSDPERLKHFIYLVDITADQGNMVAVRLQSLLQGDSSK